MKPDPTTGIDEPTVQIPPLMDCRAPVGPEQWTHDQRFKFKRRRRAALVFNMIRGYPF